MSWPIILLIVAGIIVLVFLLIFALIPLMAASNKATDRPYNADEKDLLTGIMTVGIHSSEGVGQVRAEFVNFSLTLKPAKIAEIRGKPITEIPKETPVLIIEVRDGMAYVRPYTNRLVS